MKHAASVRPEPGSNSPLSEKFMIYILADVYRLIISLAFASRLFCCPSLLFELTSFLLRFLSFSSSAILFSRFNIFPRKYFILLSLGSLSLRKPLLNLVITVFVTQITNISICVRTISYFRHSPYYQVKILCQQLFFKDLHFLKFEQFLNI